MKTIGLIGGMSWESTQTYYRLINQKVREQLGGLHSAKLILYSVDFSEIEALQHQDDWEGAAMDLGCTPLKTFFVVTLPVITPALASVWLLAFTLSLDDLVIAS